MTCKILDLLFAVLEDDKKLQVTLNVYRNLNTGGSYDEQKLMNELKDLESRLAEGKKVNLDQQPMKSMVKVYY